MYTSYFPGTQVMRSRHPVPATLRNPLPLYTFPCLSIPSPASKYLPLLRNTFLCLQTPFHTIHILSIVTSHLLLPARHSLITQTIPSLLTPSPGISHLSNHFYHQKTPIYQELIFLSVKCIPVTYYLPLYWLFSNHLLSFSPFKNAPYRLQRVSLPLPLHLSLLLS